MPRVGQVDSASSRTENLCTGNASTPGMWRCECHAALSHPSTPCSPICHSYSYREETGTCLIDPVIEGPTGVSFLPGTARVRCFVSTYDLLVQTEGEKGGKEGMERFLGEKYFPVVKDDGPDGHWKPAGNFSVRVLTRLCLPRVSSSRTKYRLFVRFDGVNADLLPQLRFPRMVPRECLCAFFDNRPRHHVRT